MNKVNQLIQKFNKLKFRVLSQFNYTKEGILVRLILILLILFFMNNIYTAYTKGVENKNLIEQEELKLAELRSEAEELKYLERYYSSVEFQRIYARESQNLAEPGETLYYVNRPEELIIDYYEETDDPITLNEHAKWWSKLILGK